VNLFGADQISAPKNIIEATLGTHVQRKSRWTRTENVVLRFELQDAHCEAKLYSFWFDEK
jgi:hypothetical protein